MGADRELIERIDQQFGTVPLNLGIIHADALADAEALAEDVRTRLQVAELLFSDIGPAIASFGGPGALGIVGFPAALATTDGAAIPVPGRQVPGTVRGN